MAYKSYRYLYKAVNKIPSKVKIVLKRITAVNQGRIAELLIKNPVEVTVGEYWREDRQVHLQQTQTWKLNSKLCTVDAVPQISVVSVVVGLNAILKKSSLPYSIWSECRVGNPAHVPWGHRGKIRYYRDKTHFKIGLVDKRQLKKPLG